VRETHAASSKGVNVKTRQSGARYRNSGKGPFSPRTSHSAQQNVEQRDTVQIQ
jgi:hypothetical protein